MKKHSPSKAYTIYSLLRVKQWIKNTFVLAPLIFSGFITSPDMIINSIVAMLLFCLASSAAYIFNDINDINYDRNHPKKSVSRPLAAGLISIPQAKSLLIIIYIVLFCSFLYNAALSFVLFYYLILNVAYTLYLKHQPVLDIFSIALGFVLRVYAGTEALSLPISSWMFVTTLCLALYLAAIKRRQELSFSDNTGRKVLKCYSVSLVNRYAEMSATGTLVFYSLFVMTVRPELAITVPLVLFGLFRYWYVVELLDGGESPTEVLFSDLPLVLTILSWIGVTLWATWPGNI